MVRDVANLRDQFAPYYAPDRAAVAAALRTGLVTPDTNVMLAAYRFERQARDELFGALEKLGERLWIPYQVALEFHRNRLGVIADQEGLFGKTREDLDAAVNSYLAKLKAFTNRIALPHASTEELEQTVRDAHEQVKSQVTSAEEGNEVHLKGRDSDDVLARLEALFDGRVGEPMQPDVFEATRKEAKRRVDHRIPPGYADKDKADPSGDYLVWKQLLEEAAARRVPVVLVTDDRKEDWVRREHGLTLGPRPELCEEMSAGAGVPFFLMSTATFLRHAKEYLRASVSPETVDQARELPAALLERNIAVAEDTIDDLRRIRDYRRMLERDLTAAAAEEDGLSAFQHAAETSGAEAGSGELQALRAQRQAARESRMTLEIRNREMMEREQTLVKHLAALMSQTKPGG
jgi:hypothetical protein